MLAYLFWHFPSERAKLEMYESALLRFHQALAAAGIEGFITSASMRVSNLPWVPRKHGYEDWYLVRDSGALDGINEAAVSALAKMLHDELAMAAQWGTGALYRHRLGSPDLGARHACWFSKPEGMTYAQVDELLHDWVRPKASVWQRYLTLGPGTEYCALCPEEVAVPSIFPASHIMRNALRPSDTHGI